MQGGFRLANELFEFGDSYSKSRALLRTFLRGNHEDTNHRDLEFLTTGCHGIDQLLGGGLPIHKLVLAYGEAATGKTILSMQCAIEAVRNDYKVFYIDADQSFSTNRMEHLIGSQSADKIILFTPEDFEGQNRTLENIEKIVTKNLTLLVVDSITGLYRTGRFKPMEYFGRDRELNRQIARLHALSSKSNLWVLLTGQVHSSPSGRDWLVEPVATRTLKHWSDIILRLGHTPRQGVRDCLVEKRNGIEPTGRHSLFKITESGIQDA